MNRPYDVVEDFERDLAEYCGAPYAVTTTSCTMALLLMLKYFDPNVPINIPKYTYIGVLQSIMNAGLSPTFRDENWQEEGSYLLSPLPIRDSARLLTSGMYKPGEYTCLSFHWAKHLPIGQGGAVLLDDMHCVEWLLRARMDGRTPGVAPKDDTFLHGGMHAYMIPEQAARGRMLLSLLPKHNRPIPEDNYVNLEEVRFEL